MERLSRRGFVGGLLASSIASLVSHNVYADENEVPQEKLKEYIKYAPQFLIGNPNATTQVDFLWSGVCPKCKRALEGFLLDFSYDVMNKKLDVALVFHHLALTEREIKAGATIKSVGHENYAEFCVRLMRWMTFKKKKITSKRIEKLIAKGGFPVSTDFDYQRAVNGMKLMRYYTDKHEMVPTTLFVNGKQIDVTKEDLLNAIST